METFTKKLKLKNFRVSKVLYENMYCNQEDFSALVCGSKNPSYYMCKNKVLGQSCLAFKFHSSCEKSL